MPLNLKTILLPLVIVLAILVVLISFPELFHPTPATLTPTPSDDGLAKAAAANGVTAFFSINETAGKQDWIDNLCRVSTESGCAFYRLGLDKLWKQFEAAHTSISPTILYAEKTSLPKKEGNTQVWKLSVGLSQALPGRGQKQDIAYALVVLEKGTWKFDRFLTPEEVKGLVK
jgi:hypothetical protein